MNMCAAHWSKLRAAIAERGLDKLVSQDGQAAGEALLADRPDPLMAAGMAIFNNALGKVGLDLMQPEEDGTMPCPICFLKANALTWPKCECGDPACTSEARAEGFERWIEHAANDQLERINGGANA